MSLDRYGVRCPSIYDAVQEHHKDVRPVQDREIIRSQFPDVLVQNADLPDPAYLDIAHIHPDLFLEPDHIFQPVILPFVRDDKDSVDLDAFIDLRFVQDHPLIAEPPRPALLVWGVVGCQVIRIGIWEQAQPEGMPLGDRDLYPVGP